MYSRFSVLLASSFLFSASAFAGTTEIARKDVSSGTSNKFAAKKSTPVAVKGTIVPKGEKCVDTVPAVEVRLERRIGGTGSDRYDRVEAKTANLDGSLSVAFNTQGNADGVYRITWVPKPNASGVSCKFDQALLVAFTDPDANSEAEDEDGD
jgi:hypothetical protein